MPNSPVQLNSFIEMGASDTYYDFASATPVASIYVLWDESFLTEEASDKDILRYAAQSPAFAFLNDPDEDAYTVEDGKAICH